MWLFPVPGGPSSSRPPVLRNKAHGAQIQNQRLRDLRVERPVEALERFELRHSGRLQAAGKEPIAASGELIGNQQLEELGVGQVVADGLLVAGQQRLGHT